MLDAYSRGESGLDEVRKQTEWDVRWFWPFERYAPVFETARKGGFDLLALNADSEDLGVVETSGLKGLSQETLERYVPSRRVFADFTNTTAFREYVAYPRPRRNPPSRPSPPPRNSRVVGRGAAATRLRGKTSTE